VVAGRPMSRILRFHVIANTCAAYAPDTQRIDVTNRNFKKIM
jgi:hypothetical protein